MLRDHTYFLKFKCTNCHDEFPNAIGVSREMEVEGIRGEYAKIYSGNQQKAQLLGLLQPERNPAFKGGKRKIGECKRIGEGLRLPNIPLLMLQIPPKDVVPFYVWVWVWVCVCVCVCACVACVLACVYTYHAYIQHALYIHTYIHMCTVVQRRVEPAA